jgi:Zn-dependent M28 family amino/carboxypeptidase
VRLQVRVDARMRGKARNANVMGEIPGQTSEIVLLAAHLDSWDITPGADDDGAGVGIVVAALKMLAASGQRPRRTIRVLLAANEEFGLSGADAYALAHAAEIPRHVLAMEADFGSGAVQTLGASVAEADWPRVQQWAVALQGQGVVIGTNANKGGSDIKPLYERGVPVLGPRQDGTAYFDTHHTTQDTVDKLDRVGIEQASRVYAVLAWTASQADNRFERMPVIAASP